MSIMAFAQAEDVLLVHSLLTHCGLPQEGLDTYCFLSPTVIRVNQVFVFTSSILKGGSIWAVSRTVLLLDWG
jgi:hypothetical protein